MKKILLPLIALCALLALPAFGSEAKTLRLIYGSAISGEILPCG